MRFLGQAESVCRWLLESTLDLRLPIGSLHDELEAVRIQPLVALSKTRFECAPAPFETRRDLART